MDGAKCCTKGLKWNEFNGKNIICCNGFLIFGPHWHTLLLSNLLIICPSIIFLIFW